MVEPLDRAGAADSIVSPLGGVAATRTLARPRNSWAAYVRSLAGPVRQLEAGLGAGQAPPRGSGETSVAESSAVDQPQETDTGARTPALDVRSGSSTADQHARTPSVTSAPELRYRVQFTADQAYVDLLEEARNLLQHELPGRDLAEVQRRALELLVHELRKRKHAATERPRSSTPAPATRQQQHATRSRHIPAEVRRNVWQRDTARCTYVDSRGQRCREQSGLEFHHQHPHARGGPPSLENITLRCRSHNDLAAEQDFGRDVIRERRAARRARGRRAGAVP